MASSSDRVIGVGLFRGFFDGFFLFQTCRDSFWKPCNYKKGLWLGRNVMMTRWELRLFEIGWRCPVNPETFIERNSQVLWVNWAMHCDGIKPHLKLVSLQQAGRVWFRVKLRYGRLDLLMCRCRAYSRTSLQLKWWIFMRKSSCHDDSGNRFCHVCLTLNNVSAELNLARDCLRYVPLVFMSLLTLIEKLFLFRKCVILWYEKLA